MLRRLLFSPLVGALASWLAVLGVLFAILAWINERWSPALSWPEAIAIGIGASILATLMASATLALFAYAASVFGWKWASRPTPPRLETPPAQGAAKADDIQPYLEPLDKRLSAVERFVKPMMDAKKAEQMQFVVDWVEKQRPPLPPRPGDAPLAAPPYENIFGVGARMKAAQHAEIFNAVGAQGIMQAPEVEAARARIRADAIYCTLKDEDEGRWQRGEEKQRWHIDNAAVDAALDVLRGRGFPAKGRGS